MPEVPHLPQLWDATQEHQICPTACLQRDGVEESRLPVKRMSDASLPVTLQLQGILA